MPKTLTKVLVVNYKGDIRILSSVPQLGLDEVAYIVKINIPDRVPPKAGTIELNLPTFAPPEFEVSATPLGWGWEKLPKPSI